MANLFDSENYPSNVPETLTVGDRWAWKREDIATDYIPTSYTLTYSFRLLSSAATEITLASSVITESSTAYIVEVPSSTTAAYTKGDYSYQEYITNASSQRVVVSSGYATLKANLDADSSDPRSHARVVFDATGNVKVFSKCDIEAGDEITITYVSQLLGSWVRAWFTN